MGGAMDAVTGVRARIDEILREGCAESDIPELASMIRDIETLEAYGRGGGTAEPDTGDIGWLLRSIEDELRAAEKYHKSWTETKDATYKTIGREELRHAEQLIKLARTKAVTAEATARLQELVAWYQVLLGKAV